MRRGCEWLITVNYNDLRDKLITVNYNDLRDKRERESVKLCTIMMMIPCLRHQRDAEISMQLPGSLKPCTSINSHPTQRFSPTEADPFHQPGASTLQVFLQSFEMLWGNRSFYSFAFVLASSPEKGNSFESINSRFFSTLDDIQPMEHRS